MRERDNESFLYWLRFLHCWSLAAVCLQLFPPIRVHRLRRASTRPCLGACAVTDAVLSGNVGKELAFPLGALRSSFTHNIDSEFVDVMVERLCESAMATAAGAEAAAARPWCCCCGRVAAAAHLCVTCRAFSLLQSSCV